MEVFGNPPDAKLVSTLKSRPDPKADQNVYAGVFTPAESPKYSMWWTNSWESVVSRWTELKSQDYRLISLTSEYQHANETYFLAFWTEGASGSFLTRTSDWNKFMETFNENKTKSRLLDIDFHSLGGLRYFAGVWGSTPVEQVLVHDVNLQTFLQEYRTQSMLGFLLTKIQVYLTATGYHLTGLFEVRNDPPGSSFDFVYVSDWDEFYRRYQENTVKNRKLTDFQVYDDNRLRVYFGVYNASTVQCQFIFDQTWSSFVSQWSNLAKQNYHCQTAVGYANRLELPDHTWDSFFSSKLSGLVKGYSYYVTQKGQMVAAGAAGLARSAADEPQTNMTVDTRVNLASVSKPITAVAVLKKFDEIKSSIDLPFFPILKTFIPNVGPGVGKISIRNLLQHKSGLTPNGTFESTDVWGFLRDYLLNQNVPLDAPGQASVYSNANYIILQAVIDVLTGHGGEKTTNYPTYVAETILRPMGIDTNVFSTIPDPESTATLGYKDASDESHGKYQSTTICPAVGGWISSAKELSKFLIGVRDSKVLPLATTQQMFFELLGWHSWTTYYGTAYHHNGGFSGISTGIMHLPEDYDVVLLINSDSVNTILTIAQAFDARVPYES